MKNSERNSFLFFSFLFISRVLTEMKAMETVHDLIEEAKLRTVWWALCIFAVSYFLTRKRFLILVLCYAHKLYDYISLSNSCNYTIFFVCLMVLE